MSAGAIGNSYVVERNSLPAEREANREVSVLTRHTARTVKGWIAAHRGRLRSSGPATSSGSCRPPKGTGVIRHSPITRSSPSSRATSSATGAPMLCPTSTIVRWRARFGIHREYGPRGLRAAMAAEGCDGVATDASCTGRQSTNSRPVGHYGTRSSCGTFAARGTDSALRSVRQACTGPVTRLPRR